MDAPCALDEVPTAHAMHEVVPNPGEKDPAKQFLQAVEPSTGALRPMAHKSQVLRPVTLVNEPNPHD